jgi:hypothetical protein
MKSPVLPLALAALGWLSLGSATAAPLVRDLGQGLLYYRAHHLPGDLPVAGRGARAACILDLRFADGDAAAPAALAAWIGFNATPRTPVFVLANPRTSAALLRPLARLDDGGLIVVGPAEAAFHPDIAVTTSPSADRQAYEALDNGTPLAALLSDNPDKPRMDEAELARERLPDSALAEGVPDRKAEPAGAVSTAPVPMPDRVLQRAVQIHRGLLALKQIP